METGKVTRDELMKTTQMEMDRKSQIMYGNVFKGDVELWKPKSGLNVIDFIYYRVGNYHPTSDIPKGKPSIKLRLRVHKNVGITEDDQVCLMNWGKPCYPDEFFRAEKAKGKRFEEISYAYPSWRDFFVIVPRDDPEEDKLGSKMFIWETSGNDKKANLGWKQITRAKSKYEQKHGGELLCWIDPVEGKSLSFYKEGEGQEGTKYVDFEFIDRGYTVPQSCLNKAFCLDEMLRILSYDELKEAFLSGIGINGDSERPENYLSDRKENGEAPWGEEKEIETKSSSKVGKRKRTRRKEVEEEKKEKPECFGTDKCDFLEECHDPPCEFFDECFDVIEAKERAANR